ncbi:DUF2381 family protein [Archangium sp.]|uniref:DUF2381 family protein n=1 Tax=Archangium sp. TaxID=1872627 RepID=UPI00389AE2E4
MLPPFLPVLVLLQGAPGAKPPSTPACEDHPRIELSQAPTTMGREICVSPGSMTGFIFDLPASVELEDEVRFTQVLRSPKSISLVPPRDMVPGERLRLTARLGAGESQQLVTFILVANPGQAARQVEVYRDRRTRESYEQEIDQERAKNQELRDENQRLRTRLLGSVGLRGLYLGGLLEGTGVKARRLGKDAWGGQSSTGNLFMREGECYRSNNSVAVGIRLQNKGAEPWSLTEAQLRTSSGEELEGLKLGPSEAIAPQEEGRVLVELDTALGAPRGELTLHLWDARGRYIQIPHVSFP